MRCVDWADQDEQCWGNAMGLFKKLKKKVAKAAKSVVKGSVKAVTLGQVDVGKALNNVEKKGLKAFGLGQITGMDRAKELAAREVAAAEAGSPDDPAGVGAEINPLPMADEADIRRNKRRTMLKAQQRGGRMSTMLSDKSDY